MKFNVFLRGFVFLSLVNLALADVRLPNVLGSGMVLQRDLPVPVWGWADVGEKVTVAFGKQTKATVAGENGKWMVKLAPLKASAEPAKLVPRGSAHRGRAPPGCGGRGGVSLCGGAAGRRRTCSYKSTGPSSPATRGRTQSRRLCRLCRFRA